MLQDTRVACANKTYLCYNHNMKNQRHFVICSCSSQDHIVSFNYDPSEDELWIEVQLHQWRSFWKRVVVAVGYVLGYESRFGHWDCANVDLDEARKLRDFLNSAISKKDGTQ